MKSFFKSVGSFLGGLSACALLTACEHLEPSKSYERDTKPGLFTGEKGYFELVPGGPESDEAFDKAPGLLSQDRDHQKEEDPVKVRRRSLEAEAAS